MKRVLYIGAIAMAMAMAACTDVQSLASIEEYDARPEVTISMDWDSSGIVREDRPDSLSVFLNRLVSTGRRWLRCPSEGMEPDDTLSLPCGEWIGIVLNEDVANVTYSGLEGFHGSDTVSVQDIKVKVDTLKYPEIISSRGSMDCNPGLPVYKPVSGLVCGFKEFSVNGVAGSDNNMEFTIEDLSSPVIFDVWIQTEGDVEVLSVQGEVAGVPGEVDMMSRELVASRCGRTIFDFEPSDDGGNEDLEQWRGTANILGIVPPKDEYTILGDGILTLYVRVLSANSKMTFIASMNLKPLLDAEPVLTLAGRNLVYRKSGSGSAVYKLSSVLSLTPDGVEPPEGKGVGEWVNQAKQEGGI